jgi:hypothetical protein
MLLWVWQAEKFAWRGGNRTRHLWFGPKVAGSLPTAVKQTFQLARCGHTQWQHHEHISSPECTIPKTKIYNHVVWTRCSWLMLQFWTKPLRPFQPILQSYWTLTKQTLSPPPPSSMLWTTPKQLLVIYHDTSSTLSWGRGGGGGGLSRATWFNMEFIVKICEFSIGGK